MSETNVVKYYEHSIDKMPWWPKFRHKYREPIAEFFGCFMMILLGVGCNFMVIAGKGAWGGWSQINWGWGCAVMIGVYCSGGISGGHLNPAVTLAMCVYRKFPWKKFLPYAIAQFLGCFIASFVAYGNFLSAINFSVGNGVREVVGANATAGAFGTYPQEFMMPVGAFFSEVITTGSLVVGIFAINDSNNLPAGHLAPIIIFFILYGIGCSLGWNTGYVMNPARDLAPRLASYILGYGSEVWTSHDHYAWNPIVAPCIGALTGGFFYDFFIYTGIESPINQPFFGLRGSGEKIDDGELGNTKGDHIMPGHVHGHSYHPTLENITYDDAGREVVVEYHQNKQGAEVHHVEHSSPTLSMEKARAGHYE